MFLLLIGIILILLYCYGSRNYDYWKKKCVKYDKPYIFFGNLLHPFLNNMSTSKYYATLYNNYPNEKYVGVFTLNNPVLVLRDPEIIKQVLSIDFKYFCNRGLINEDHKHEILLQNLFFYDGDVWKLVRQQTTLAFSGAKLKAMFPLIADRIGNLLEVADNFANNNVEVNIKELMARYTTDFIGACGFGLNIETLDDKNSEFRKIGKRIVKTTKRDVIVRTLKQCIPKLTGNLKFFTPDLESFFISLLRRVMSERKYRHSGRNDFIDTLLDIRQKRVISGESIEKTNPDGSPAHVKLEITDNLLVAQVFGFFVGGFETSSIASSFLLHMLAYHPAEQNRCQIEIDEVLKKYDGKFSFNAINDMKYLKMALRECLRIFSPVGFIIRECVTQYTFTKTNLSIDKGTQIIIPLEALHTDEKYFVDPHEFRPSRFDSDDIENSAKFVYMPFGEGPRNCIGTRLGLMLSLAGVAAMLSRYTVAPSKNSVLVPKVSVTSFILQDIIGGLPVALKYRHRV